jgi:hypothetical protein
MVIRDLPHGTEEILQVPAVHPEAVVMSDPMNAEEQEEQVFSAMGEHTMITEMALF